MLCHVDVCVFACIDPVLKVCYKWKFYTLLDIIKNNIT